MPPAPLPSNELERIAALRSYDVLAGKRDESLDAICRVVASIFSSPIALVSISDTNRQVVKGRFNFGPDELARELAPCAYAILGEEPMVVNDLRDDARFIDNPLLGDPTNLRFYVGAPLLTPDHLALGTLCAIDTAPHDPSGELLANLADLSRTVMALFNMRKAISRTRSLALTDTLTGLNNRSGLILEVQTVIERAHYDRSPFALIYLDADNFKYVNDTRGHAAGDDVLNIIGDVLARCVRPKDIAGRLGGDEFAILVPDCDGAEADQIANRLFANLTAAMTAKKYPIGFSVGVASFPTPPADVEEAFLIADRLMYAAKHGGKNRIVTLSNQQFGVGA